GSAAGGRLRSSRHGDVVPDERARVRLAALAEMKHDAPVGALDLVNEPRASVDALAEGLADLLRLAVVGAALDLASLGVLADPDRLAVDAGRGRGRAARLPDGLGLEGGLLAPGDLAQRLPQLLRGRVSPVPEAAPDPMDAQQRVEHEGER